MGRSKMAIDTKQLQQIPAVDTLLRESELVSLNERLAHETMIALIREAIDSARAGYLAGTDDAEFVNSPGKEEM